MEERQEVIHGVGKGDIHTKNYVEFHLVLLAADGERVRLYGYSLVVTHMPVW